MAKTKTLGIRTTPQLIDELEELKKAFNFDSYSEMLSSLAQVLKSIDQRVSQIQDHPRTWSVGEARRLLSMHSDEGDAAREQIPRLVWRRLRQRFGEDGVETLRQKLESAGRDAK
jgi:hypothetical protein